VIKNLKLASIISRIKNPNGTFFGKKHSLKTKELMSQIAKDRLKDPSKNTQFGTCWIWHELIGAKKCKKELLPFYIDQGWYKGRIINGLKHIMDYAEKQSTVICG
jgi:hypothetical protein